MSPRPNMKYLEQHITGALERQAWPLVCGLVEERDLLDCGEWVRQKVAGLAKHLIQEVNNKLNIEADKCGFDVDNLKHPLVSWEGYRINGLHSKGYYEAEAKRSKVYDIIADRTKELCVKVAMGMTADELMAAIKDTDFSAVKKAVPEEGNKNTKQKGNK